MPNRHYQKGQRAEYIVRDVLRDHGWLVMRSYASKGSFDLLAIHPDRDPVMVEVKTGTGWMGPADRAELVDIATDYGAEAVLAHYEAGAVHFARLLPGDGRDLWTP